MRFLHELTKKPWLPEQAALDNQEEGAAFFVSASTLGLRVLLAVLTVVFSLFIIAYGDRMAVYDWRPLPEPWLLWINTAILALSSVAMQRGLSSARRMNLEGLKSGLTWGGVFALGFLVGQLWVWQTLLAQGFFAAENPANAFFYLLTAVHGIHLLGGFVAWGRIAAKISRDLPMEKLRASMELCTVYWHFLLAVWLVLFVLLLFT